MVRLKKKNSIYFALTIVVCAILAVVLSKTNLADKGPKNLIVDTRYSDPLGEDGLFLRRGEQALFELSDGIYDWKGGGEKKTVLSTLGLPKYKLEFMDEDYYVWEQAARYDWDLRNERPGRFLTLSFNYKDRVDSVAISWNTPFRARPLAVEELTSEFRDELEENVSPAEPSDSAQFQD